MGKRIVITSGKGGVGKTTTSANLGASLAKLGNRVVIIDGDIGLRNLDVVLGMENRIVYDIIDVVQDIVKPERATIKDKRIDNLYILPASQTRDKDAITVGQMEKIVNELSETFDYVLIDCPAGIEQGFKNAIAGAESAIVVVTPEISSIRDADRVIGLLDSEGITNVKVLVNRVRTDMVLNGEMLDMEDITDILRVDIVGIIPDDMELIVSTNKGEPVILNDKAQSGQAFVRVAKRLTGEKVEIPNFNLKEGIMSKIKRVIQEVF